MLRYIALPVVGFLIGMLIISLGGGGGAYYVGILTAFFNVSPAIAASTSLATIIPTTATGAFSHWKAGNVNFRYGVLMLGGGIAGSVAGSLCSDLLPLSLYNKITGAILILLSVQMAVTYLKKHRKKGAGAEPARGLARADIIKALSFGALGGAMSGLVGLSGGAPVVAGLMFLGCGALETVGTSVLVLLGISVTGFLMHVGLGTVDWKLVGLLAVGTMSGAFTGPVILKRLDRRKMEAVLQPILALMTVVMGVLVILK